MKTKTPLMLAALALPFAMVQESEAVLVIAGVTDGDLSGGNPKAIILQAGADVPDLSIWGVGSANNGGGTDGEELSLPAGSAWAGDVFVIPSNANAAAPGSGICVKPNDTKVATCCASSRPSNPRNTLW